MVSHVLQNVRYQRPSGLMSFREVPQQIKADHQAKEQAGKTAVHFYMRSRIADVSLCSNYSLCLSNSFLTRQSTLSFATSCSPKLSARVDGSSSRSNLAITRSIKLILGVTHSGFEFRLRLRASLLISRCALPALGLHGTRLF